MANFIYKKQTVGKTTSAFEVPITATVAIGDLITSDGSPAGTAASTIEFIAMEGGTSGDSPILAMPTISGITILEGTVDATSGVTAGENVGIDDSQNVDQNASNDLFLVLEDAGTGEQVKLLVTAGL